MNVTKFKLRNFWLKINFLTKLKQNAATYLFKLNNKTETEFSQ